MQSFLEGTDYAQASVGFTPWADVHEIPFVPKGRYGQMGPFLARTGDLSAMSRVPFCA